MAARSLIAVLYRAGRAGVPSAASFRRWVGTVLTHARRRHAGLNIAIIDRMQARELNRQFRGRDYATNVLSFPYEPGPGERTALLGDIGLCAPVVAHEAAEQRKPLRNHYAHLTVHGVLHLLGHDHENERDARRMEAIERRILATFGIPDPYE
jgi:probable rRNA maturation factor